MPALNVAELGKTMLGAAKAVLLEKWPEVKLFAESESKKLAQNLAEVAQWRLEGKIDDEQAGFLIGIHKRSYKMVLTSLEGISLAMAEKAINASIDAARGTVNAVIGFALL